MIGLGCAVPSPFVIAHVVYGAWTCDNFFTSTRMSVGSVRRFVVFFLLCLEYFVFQHESFVASSRVYFHLSFVAFRCLLWSCSGRWS